MTEEHQHKTDEREVELEPETVQDLEPDDEADEVRGGAAGCTQRSNDPT
jgi:hypothetical protein